MLTTKRPKRFSRFRALFLDASYVELMLTGTYTPEEFLNRLILGVLNKAAKKVRGKTAHTERGVSHLHKPVLCGDLERDGKDVSRKAYGNDHR